MEVSMLSLPPLPRAVVVAAAAFAAGAVVFAATQPAHAFMRPPGHGFARMPGHAFARMPGMPAGALRPGMTTRMPAASDPGNLELTVKVLNTPSRQPGYAQGEVLVHIESGLPGGAGRTPSALKVKRAVPVSATRLRGNGAQTNFPPIGWKYSNLKVKIER
jgi:hypothetical protein